MVLSSRERDVAAGIWHVACGQVVRMAGDEASDAALAALMTPSPENIRALLAVGVGRPWRPSIVDALAEIGVIAAYDILGGYGE